jgi:hypothetical protein
MVRLFDSYNLRHIFEPGFPGLIEAFYVQEKLVEWIAPEIHEAFVGQFSRSRFSYALDERTDATHGQSKHGISSSSYATKWYITLFANSIPFATQLRLWDALLLEGGDFLIITAVAIIWRFKSGSISFMHSICLNLIMRTSQTYEFYLNTL